jgi:SAM-dependent methyltransferase
VTTYRGQLLRYELERARLPSRLAGRVIGLGLDPAARAFIDAACERPHSRLLGLAHRLLRPVLSDFDINGLLGTHPLHLLSTEQWRTLLGDAPRRRLLDVGAGSGDVTSALLPLFDQVSATETSWAMARRLRRRGIECLRLDAASDPLPDAGFDVVSCLNVIDRCDAPRSLLRQLAGALAPGGLLVVATPLPIQPFVYEGGTTREPREALACRAGDWEGAATELFDHELEPLGLPLTALARAPYLSRGFAARPLYVLDDAIFVCEKPC